MAIIKDLRAITPRTNGTRALSAIKNIARHHSATTSGNWAAFWRHWNGTLKWGTGGYHEIILRDGTVELCYDPIEITNGVGGQNSYIYNICLVGSGSFTAAQEKTFDERARYWMRRLGLPASAVKGHNEFPGQSTNCPGINMNTVRTRLNGPVTPEAPPKKEDVRMLKTSSETLKSSVINFISAATKDKTLSSDKWEKQAKAGTLTLDDALALKIEIDQRRKK